MAFNNTNVVYIDTNLDTHLALVVSDLDTVSDLKKSILLEHPLCFPKFGQIRIHGVKVKRRSCFYHLSDSMLVRTAFSGSNKNWLLSVDASVLGECAQNEQLFAHGSPNQVACVGIANNALIGHAANAVSSPSKRVSAFDNFNLPHLHARLVENQEIPAASPHVSEHTAKGVVEILDTGAKSSGGNDTGIPLPASVPPIEDHCFVNQELVISSIECKVDASGKGLKDDRNAREENPLISVPSAKKKRKTKVKKEVAVQDDKSKEAAVVVENAISFPSKRASSVNNKLPGSAIECELDRTNKGIRDACIVLDEGNCKSVPNVKKKQKGKRKKEDTVLDDGSKENEASVVGSDDYTTQQHVEVIANPSEDADKEVIKETEVIKEHQHPNCNNNTTKTDINSAVSMKKVSESEPAANKKKRKRSSTVDSKEMLKVEITSQKDEVHKSGEAHNERKQSEDWFELKNEKSRDDVEYQADKVTENILAIGPPAKKKRKSKEKSGEKSLSKAKMINDFNVGNVSHHVLKGHQKIKNSNADQSGEHFNDTDPLKTSVQGKRRNRKINSSNSHETTVVTSSKKDEEADHSSIQRVQEQISEDGLFSKDISTSKTTIEEMETGTDACKKGIQSIEKTTGNYRNHCHIEIKAHTSDVGESTELTEHNENVVLDLCHKNEAGQIQGAEEGREVSPPNNPKLMLLEKSTSCKDNTDANIGELNVTSKVLDVNGMTEPIKSEKKESGTRKVKNSGGGSALREGIGLVDAAESGIVIMKSLGATKWDPTSENTKTEDNPLNQTEGEKILHEEVQGISDKDNDFSVDNAVPLGQITTKSNAEHTEQRQRKKSNKQTSTSKKASRSSDSGKHGKPSVVLTKKIKSTSPEFTNKSSKTNLELVENSVGLEPSDSRFNSWGKDAFQHSTHSLGERGDDRLEAPSKTLKVNVDPQFSSWKQPDETNLSDYILVDKMNAIDRTSIESMAGNNMRELEATNGQTHAEDFSSSQKLSSKEELDVRIHPAKKVPNVHKTGQDSKLSGQSDNEVFLIVENRKVHVNASGKSIGLEKQRKQVPVSNSKLKGSIKMVQNKAGKASGNNVHGVVSKIQQKKSLLAGAIFKDDSSSTSEDDVDNTDASTRTPSDNPLLSDFSDGDSSSGSYGGRSSLKATLSGTKGMKIDAVLRSSSRFKKARTTASQLEETESQPEFVPDSLAE